MDAAAARGVVGAGMHAIGAVAKPAGGEVAEAAARIAAEPLGTAWMSRLGGLTQLPMFRHFDVTAYPGQSGPAEGWATLAEAREFVTSRHVLSTVTGEGVGGALLQVGDRFTALQTLPVSHYDGAYGARTGAKAITTDVPELRELWDHLGVQVPVRHR